ncbi:MptD family putative ECF transporter S component [Clostridium sp. D2Q-14]|uniref:MptD family putative ECF transporter S component n=1 Tax=Anaeromonas gelatinilytica TaxID=2683194 RepID=UPI00193C6C5D|nr:MptD family putative ECF transporter S component [Anaeromonas gelatinilytica]MBS4534960.1 MptD family putative ECF transporter S component [Anaeromonas gelatinilytica]
MNIQAKKNNLSSKDLINISIFTLLFAICMFLVAGIAGMIPAGFVFHGAIAAIPCGIIYMYIRAKTPKKGSIIVQSILFAIIYFVMGNPISIPISILLGGVLAEIISSTGKYISFWRNTIGFALVTVITWLGFMFNMMFQKQYYMEYATGRGSSAAYVEKLLNLANGPMFYAAIVVTVICAFLGAILGRKLLKKHFMKAGMV